MGVKMKRLLESYTVEEVAEGLKLHPYTVRRLSREKKIPAFKCGGQWRFDINEIENWRKRQKAKPRNSKQSMITKSW